MASVRSGDRRLMVEYVDDIALQRFADGFPAHEVCNALSVISDVVTRELTSRGEFDGMRQEIHDHVGITMQLAQDEVEDVYERLEGDTGRARVRYTLSSPEWQRRGERIRQLSERYETVTAVDQTSDG